METDIVGAAVASPIKDSRFIFNPLLAGQNVQGQGSPVSFDRILSSRYGVAALEATAAGASDVMVCLKNNSITTVSLAKATKRRKTVDPQGELVHNSGRMLDISFGDYPSSIPTYAFLIFQTVFCATAATIVAGAMAERAKFSTCLIFSLVLSGLIYPISGHWIWDGGCLSELGFHDFAGSTAVHIRRRCGLGWG